MVPDPQTPISRVFSKPVLMAARFAFLILASASILFFILGLSDSYHTRSQISPETLTALQQIGLTSGVYALLYLVPIVLLAVIYVGVGGVIAWRKNKDVLVLLVAFSLIGQGVYAFAPLSLLAAYHPGWYFPVYFLGSFIKAAIVFGCYLFPDGRFVPRLAMWTGLFWLFWLLFGAFVPTSPLNLHLNGVFHVPGVVIFYGSGVVAQIYRYRHRATAIQRQQTKWIVYGLVLAIGGGVGIQVVNLLLPWQNSSLSTQLVMDMLLRTISVLAQSVLPFFGIFAILRYRLFDIDFLINRSLVYGMLTVLLATVFGAILYLVAHLTNDATIALALAAGAAGAIFQPTRRQLQLFVDRRFYNIQIDYQKHALASHPARTNKTQGVPETVFGDYRKLERIGQGGMATIFKAEHCTRHELVAIKILTQNHTTDPDIPRRFEREAKTVSGLQHENIVKVFDYGVTEGLYYIIMEYVAGSDLGNYLHQQGRLSFDTALPIFRQIANALDYAHQHGIVHRDIKPTNIMLDKSETGPSRAVVMDFGLAKLITAVTRLTTTGLLGTLDYIAPEQIQDAATVDGRADVYAFGVMTYQLLTGELPFKHNNLGALLIAHLMQPPPDVCSIVPELPKNVSAAIMRAMAKRPDERYPTLTAFVSTLERVYESQLSR